MKQSIIVIGLFLFSFQLFAQIDEVIPPEKRTSLTVGILQGGGSIVGADFFTQLVKEKIRNRKRIFFINCMNYVNDF
jgi:hypothetical protein